MRLVALSQEAFAEAVEDALHDYLRPDVLRGNPLWRSCVQSRAAATAGDADLAAELRSLIKVAAEQLQQSPKENKYYRAVHHTYLQPALTRTGCW